MGTIIEETLRDQIKAGEELLERAESIPEGTPSDLTKGIVHYDERITRRLAADVNCWERSTYEILKSLFVFSPTKSEHYHDLIRNKKNFLDFREDIIDEIIECNGYLRALIITAKLDSQTSSKGIKKQVVKSPKVFISHKKEDKAFADALVSMINFIIGSSGDKVFCSSIPGYGIRQSKDIFEELKAQFDNHDIFMVIIHSPRYYKSVVCLNEMGASWVLGTKFSSFMTKDCSYELLQGVIGSDDICINLNDELGMLNSHLNDFKNDLLAFFGASAIDENKWEHARNRFINEVSALEYDSADKILPKESSRVKPAVVLSNEEIEILKKWIDSNVAQAHSVQTKDGSEFIVGQDCYVVNDTRKLVKWHDFFDRLEKAGFVVKIRITSQGNSVYQLKKPAFDYLESLTEN